MLPWMEQLITSYREKFGEEPTHRVRSPLRICPLGAHVDHQDGLVTGMALTDSINLAFAPEQHGYIRVQSLDFPDEEYFHLDQVPEMVPGFWGNYLRGAVLSLQNRFKLRRGIKGTIQGNLPIGGLSSSAAVTTAYLMALCEVNDLPVSPAELIDFSHWVETQFIGLNNGILDQSANILSRQGRLMSMDCLTGEHDLVPAGPGLEEFEIVIVYSGISTALISTDYNNRVDECKVAAWTLGELGDLPVVPFHEVTLRQIPEEVYRDRRAHLAGRFQRRADHYFSEVDRVRRGVEAWGRGDLEEFGRLVFESGMSSIEHYESGCPELTTIYRILRDTTGVYGARFSGAGYRGCCIGLTDPAHRAEIRTRIVEEYPKAHPAYADVFDVFFTGTGDGAEVIPL